MNPTAPNRYVVAVAAVVLQIGMGSLQAWSVFRDPLSMELGRTIAEVTWAYTITLLAAGVSVFFGGLALARWGSRRIAIAAALCNGLGLSLGGLAAEPLWLFYLTFGLIGGIGRGLGYLVPVALLIAWFPERRGLMAGVGVVGWGIAALVTAPAATILIPALGALHTLTVLGVVSLGLTVTAAVWLQSPPDRSSTVIQGAQSGDRGSQVPAYDLGAATGTWQWYALTAVFVVHLAAGFALLAHAAPLAQERTGMAAVAAGRLVGLIGLADVVGRLGWPWLSDSLGRRPVLGLVLAAETAAFAGLALGPGQVAFALLTWLAIACLGGGLALLGAIVADYFGSRHVGAVAGAMASIATSGAGLGSLLLAYVRETSGSYEPGLWLVAGALVAAGALLVTTSAPKQTHRPVEPLATPAARAGVL
ncbi:MAG: MFS transporter [Chloroflexi bacterium]|nr:MFS transporter [Chloroflexota bacterium]